MARPTTYNEEIIKKAEEYLSLCVDKIEEYHKTRGEKSDGYDRIVRVRLPTIEGLAVYLNINRDTIYAWCKEHKEFSDIIEKLKESQADKLLNNGLSGDYNSTIVKLMLSKHGYTEKQEMEHTGGVTINVVKYGDIEPTV